jgi:hypothetical protein
MEEKRMQDCSSAVEYPQYCTPVGIAARERCKIKHKGQANRFVGVDLSKQNCYVCIINREGSIVVHQKFSLRSPRRNKLYETLEEGDLVLMEASTGTFNIENSLHWHLDTVFHEDALALSDRNAALNQSILNKACLSLLKKLSDLKGGTQKISKKRLRMMFGWNFNQSMAEALALMDPKTFAKSVEIIPRKSK